MIVLWKVNKYYDHNNIPTFIAAPYNLLGHLKCCLKWYGIKGLKWCYLSKQRAKDKANRLNMDLSRKE